jgi:hypothetical protein
MEWERPANEPVLPLCRRMWVGKSQLDMSGRRVRIASAGNTANHALEVLDAKGYSVVLYPDASEDGLYDYWATKDGRDFVARDPVEVLGLVTFWEQFGDDWRDRDVPSHHDALMRAAFPQDDYASLTEEQFANVLRSYRAFFDAIDVQMPDNPTRAQLAALVKSFYIERGNSSLTAG